MQPINILLIENDPIKKDLIKMAVNRLPCYINCADNNFEAIYRIEKSIPDVIIMECLLPGMNGFELLKHIKAKKLGSDIYIIMLTSLVFEEIIDQAISLGVNEVVSFPFDIDDLIQRLEKIQKEKTGLNIAVSTV